MLRQATGGGSRGGRQTLSPSSLRGPLHTLSLSFISHKVGTVVINSNSVIKWRQIVNSSNPNDLEGKQHMGITN